MSRAWRRYVLCGARDVAGRRPRCTKPIGTCRDRWHLETRRGRYWASWRGPVPGEVDRIIGTDWRPAPGGVQLKIIRDSRKPSGHPARLARARVVNPQVAEGGTQ